MPTVHVNDIDRYYEIYGGGEPLLGRITAPALFVNGTRDRNTASTRLVGAGNCPLPAGTHRDLLLRHVFDLPIGVDIN